MKNLFLDTHHIQETLEASHISSAVIGGIAVAFWGEPRLTRDADLKVLLERKQASQLLSVLKKECTFLADDPLATLKKFGFIFCKTKQGTRIDLLLSETSFDQKVIQRVVKVTTPPPVTSLKICTAEDLIIYKLVSTRPRDHEDAVSVIKRQHTLLDARYVLDWLNQFEPALDDSTLISRFQELMKNSSPT